MASSWSITKCPFHLFVYSVVAVAGVSICAIQIESSIRRKRVPLPKELDGTTSYDKEVKAALEIAIKAGDNLLEALNQPKDVEQKGDVDFVTATDKLNEKIIFEHLKAKFPHHEFIGEESAAESASVPALSSKPTWIIDPIDGNIINIHLRCDELVG